MALKQSSKSRKKDWAYLKWRRKVAEPYLNEKFGRQCAMCGKANVLLDVDHIVPRSSAPDRIMDVTNVQYLCRFECHNKKHFGDSA